MYCVRIGRSAPEYLSEIEQHGHLDVVSSVVRAVGFHHESSRRNSRD
jgi:hypothetical protein